MMKTSASNLKAKMGRYMRAVRQGKEVVVTDRNEPVARLVPYRREGGKNRSLVVAMARDPAAPPLGQVEVEGIEYAGTDTTAMLVEERRRR